MHVFEIVIVSGVVLTALVLTGASIRRTLAGKGRCASCCATGGRAEADCSSAKPCCPVADAPGKLGVATPDEGNR